MRINDVILKLTNFSNCYLFWEGKNTFENHSYFFSDSKPPAGIKTEGIKTEIKTEDGAAAAAQATPAQPAIPAAARPKEEDYDSSATVQNN